MKLKAIISTLALAGSLMLNATSVNAAPISVVADNFGDITTIGGNTVTFSGSGIPTNAVNWSDFSDGQGNTLRLGIGATQRFGAPTPTNDGAGTFFVEPGLDSNGVGSWNFSFFAEIEGQLDIQAINLELLFDLDPMAGTDVASMGVLNISNFLVANSLPSTQISEGSQNPTFGFLSVSAPSILTPGALSAFDPNSGEYSFGISAEGFGSVGINVNVNAVSAPSIGIIGALSIFSLMYLRRRNS